MRKLLFTLGISALACSNSPPVQDAGSTDLCIPGQSIACAGPQSCAGFQICAADGQSLGPCQCGAGSSSGGTSSGSSTTSNSASSTGSTSGGSTSASSNGSTHGTSTSGSSGEGSSGSGTGSSSGTTSSGATTGSNSSGSGSGSCLGEVASQVTLLGGFDPGGVSVSLTNSDFSAQTTTDRDGGYDFLGVPCGTYSLSFSKTLALPPDAGYPSVDGGLELAFEATVPQLLSVPGNDGLVLDEGNNDPIASLELPPALQLASGDFWWSPSPDGTSIAFQDSNNALWILPTSGGSPLQLGTNLANGGGSFQFSPNGLHLAFVDSNGALWTVLAAGGSPVQVVANGAAGYLFEFSPDSSYLVTLVNSTSTDSLWIAPAAGGSSTELSTSVPPDLPQFSPDSLHLAFIDTAATLWLVPPAGGTAVQVATDAVDFAFSPDSSHVAFLATSSASVSYFDDLWIASTAGGSPSQVAVNVYVYNSSFLYPDNAAFQFMPSGKLVYEEATSITLGDAAQDLWTALADGGSPSEMTSTDDVADFLLSPDGSQCAFRTQASGSTVVSALWLIPTGGVTPIQLATGQPSVYTYGFSPNSAYVVFETQGSNNSWGLSIAPTADGTATQLTANLSPGEYAFSSDSSLLAFVTGPDSSGMYALETITASGGSLTQIATDGSNISFAFSPDSRLLAFEAPDSSFYLDTLAIVSTSGGTPLAINHAPSTFLWANSGTLVNDRLGTPAPYSFLDGLYATQLP